MMQWCIITKSKISTCLSSWSLLRLLFLQVFPSEIDFGEASQEEALTEISPQVYLNFLFWENYFNFIFLKMPRLWMTYTTRCEALWRTETKYFARSLALTPSPTYWQSAVIKQSLIIGQKSLPWAFLNSNIFWIHA